MLDLFEAIATIHAIEYLSKGKSDRNAIAMPINNARGGETLRKTGRRKRGLWR